MKSRHQKKFISLMIFSTLTIGALITSLLIPNNQDNNIQNTAIKNSVMKETHSSKVIKTTIPPKEAQTPTRGNDFQYFPTNNIVTLSKYDFNKRGGQWETQFQSVFGQIPQDSPFYIFMNHLLTNQSAVMIPNYSINQDSLNVAMVRTDGVLNLSNLNLENYMLDIFKFFNLTKVKELDLSGNKLNFLPDNLFARTVFLDTSLPNQEDSNNITNALINSFLNLETLRVDNNVGFDATAPIFKEDLLRQPTFTGEWFQNAPIADVSFIKSGLNNNSLQPLLDGGGDTFFRSLVSLNISQNPQITNEPIVLGGTSIEPTLTTLLHLWNQKNTTASNGRVFNASNCNIFSIDVNDLIAKNYSSILSKGFKELNFAGNNEMFAFAFNSKTQPPRVKPFIFNLDLTNTKIRVLDDFAGFMPNNIIKGDGDSNFNPSHNVKLSLEAVNVASNISVLPPLKTTSEQKPVVSFRTLEIPLETFPTWIYKSGQSNGSYFWNSLLSPEAQSWAVTYRASPESKPVNVKDLFEEAFKVALTKNQKTIKLSWQEIDRRADDPNKPSGDNVITDGFHDSGEFSFTNGVEFILNVITNNLEQIQIDWDLRNNKSFFLLSEFGNTFKSLAFKKPDAVLNKEIAPETAEGLIDTRVLFENNILASMISKDQLKLNDKGFNWQAYNLQLVGSRQIPEISQNATKPIGISIVPQESKINNDLGSVSLKIKVIREDTIKFIYSPQIFGFQAEDPKIVPHEVVQILSNLDILTNLPESNREGRFKVIQKNIEDMNSHYAKTTDTALIEDFKANAVFAILNQKFTKNLNVESIIPNGATPLISFENFNNVSNFTTTLLKVNFKYLTSKDGVEKFEVYDGTFELKKLEDKADVQLSGPTNSEKIHDKILEIGSTKALNSPLTIGEIFLRTLPSEINKPDLYFYWEAFFSKTSGISDKNIEIKFDKNNSRNAFDDTGAISFEISLELWTPDLYKFETTNINRDFSTIWQLFKRTPTNFYWNSYDTIQTKLKTFKLEANVPEIQKTTIQQLLTMTEQNINLVSLESLDKLNSNLKTLEANQPIFYSSLLKILINEKLSWRINLDEQSNIPILAFSLATNEMMNQGKIFLNIELPHFYEADINFLYPESGTSSSRRVIKQEIKIIKAITETAETPNDFNTNISSPILWIDENFLTNNKIDINQTVITFKQQIADNIPSTLRIPNQLQSDSGFWNTFKQLNPDLLENIIIIDAKTTEPLADDAKLTPDQNLLIKVYFNYDESGKTISSIATSAIINSSTFLFESLGNAVVIAAAAILGVSALITVLLSVYLLLDKRKHLKATQQFKATLTKEKQKIAATLTPEDKLKRLDLVKQDDKIQKVLDFSATLEKTVFSEKEPERQSKKPDEEF